MKKIVSIVTIFAVLFLLIFSTSMYAVTLDTIEITTNKQTVHPGENVIVNIAFGQELGSYTANVDYDNNLFEYVGVEGATANDTGTKVKAYYYDQTGGSTPRNSMSVTFKAKDTITTSNPTDFSITLEGLANPDASVTYDDVTTPIIKNVMVEPVYVDYKIALNYTGDVMVNEEKDMEIVISSSMGKNYEKARIIAEVTVPEGGNVKLLAVDDQNLEHDIIDSGWGDPQGDKIGGKDMIKRLQTKGIFTTKGEYAITLKLIDRENSDAVIASETFRINVKEKEEQVTPETPVTPDNKPTTPTTPETGTSNKPQTPTTLPKTGNTIYLSIIPIVASLVGAYVILKRKDTKNK